MNSDEQFKLGHRQQAAIRAYLLKLVALPGFAATIISFILGFAVRDYAVKSAEASALQNATTTLIGFVEEVTRSRDQAEEAANKAKTAAESLGELQGRAVSIVQSLEVQEAIGNTSDLTRSVAEALARNDEFYRDIKERAVGDLDQSVFQDVDFIKFLLPKGVAESGERVLQIRSGSTPRRKTDWRTFKNTSELRLHVDTSEAGFNETPFYFVALVGHQRHWEVQGSNSIYNPTKDGFDLYIQYPKAISPGVANSWGWRVNWVAIGR